MQQSPAKKIQLVELRPERALLKENFDTYRLSLTAIPMVKTELPPANQPNRIPMNDQHFLYIHAQLYALHNHLVRDPWTSGHSYFVDISCMVQLVQYDAAAGGIKPIREVYKMPTVRLEKDGIDPYNVSLLFVSAQLALLNDGVGTVRLLETGDRTAGGEWKLKGEFVNKQLPIPAGGSILMDGRCETQENGETAVHFVGASIDYHASVFKTVLQWVRMVPSPDAGDRKWQYDSVRVLRGGGYPAYCCLDEHCNAIIVASDKSFQYCYDSANPIRELSDSDSSEQEGSSTQPEVSFFWSQTAACVTIIIMKRLKAKYRVLDDDRALSVYCGETLLMSEANFYGKVQRDLTSWTDQGPELVITLVKETRGIKWPYLFPDAPDEMQAEAEDLPPVSNLDAPLEDCDFGDEGSDKEFAIERLDGRTHETSHRVNVGRGPPLFSTFLQAGKPPALVLRHEHDACLWLQQNEATAEWKLRHEGTLPAFGYVQASKTQRKFISCSPDIKYAVICEAERHLFIYKTDNETTGGLRNRSGPQVSIGQQKVVTLHGLGEVLGICCETDYVLLLTDSALVTLQLCIEE